MSALVMDIAIISLLTLRIKSMRIQIAMVIDTLNVHVCIFQTSIHLKPFLVYIFMARLLIRLTQALANNPL